MNLFNAQNIWSFSVCKMFQHLVFADTVLFSKYMYASIAQIVEVAASAVLGEVVEVRSSNLALVIHMFLAFTGIINSFYLSNILSIFIINLYHFLIRCSSNVMVCEIICFKHLIFI